MTSSIVGAPAQAPAQSPVQARRAWGSLSFERPMQCSYEARNSGSGLSVAAVRGPASRGNQQKAISRKRTESATEGAVRGPASRGNQQKAERRVHRWGG